MFDIIFCDSKTNKHIVHMTFTFINREISNKIRIILLKVLYMYFSFINILITFNRRYGGKRNFQVLHYISCTTFNTFNKNNFI